LAVRAELTGGALRVQALVDLTTAVVAELAGGAAQLLAVFADALDADRRRGAHDPPAAIHAVSRRLVAALIAGALHLGAALGHAEVLDALVAARAGELARLAQERARALAAGEARHAPGHLVLHAVAVVVAAIADLGAGQDAALADEA